MQGPTELAGGLGPGDPLNPGWGAPGPSRLGTGDINTMQAITPMQLPDTSMTPPLARLLSPASGIPPHSTGKERDAESERVA